VHVEPVFPRDKLKCAGSSSVSSVFFIAHRPYRDLISVVTPSVRFGRLNHALHDIVGNRPYDSTSDPTRATANRPGHSPKRSTKGGTSRRAGHSAGQSCAEMTAADLLQFLITGNSHIPTSQ
jgi:hypothetical protein